MPLFLDNAGPVPYNLKYRGIVMGSIYTDISLENSVDAAKAAEGLIKKTDIRRARVKALVDTGAGTLVIGEKLCRQLGLIKWFESRPVLAGGQHINGYYTRPLDIYWKDRSTSCNPLVVENQDIPLLGALVLEGLDLILDPLNETVVGRHGDKQECFIM
jgi:predicted aspartyl protease